MEELIGAIPDFTYILFITVTAVVALMALLIHRRLENTPWSPVRWGLDTWAVVHEGVEMVYVFFLMEMSTLFYPTFQIFARGACVIGPVVALLGGAYVYAKKTGADFEDMAIGILVGSGFLVLLVNALWADLPAVALAVAFYAPVIIGFTLTGILMYLSGAESNWLFGLVAIAIGHELGEAVIFHRIGIKLLRGADPAVSKSMFLIFLILQIIGPAILWYQSRKEEKTSKSSF